MSTEERLAALEAALFRQNEEITRLRNQVAVMQLTRKPAAQTQTVQGKPSIFLKQPGVAADFLEKYRQAVTDAAAEPGKTVELPKGSRLGDYMP